MDSKIYGEFELVPDALVPEGQLSLTLSPSELMSHWQRCGQISDFVAGYVSTAYSAEPATRDLMFTAISTVFQELIENAAKFSRKREASISVRVRHFSRILVYEVENTTTPAFAERFAEYLEQIARADDLGAVYLAIVEAQTESPAEALRSGIGLLVLRKDHEVRLGVRFSADEAGRPVVTVRAFHTLEGV